MKIFAIAACLAAVISVSMTGHVSAQSSSTTVYPVSNAQVQVTPQPAASSLPEPGGFLALGCGLVGFAGVVMRNKQHRNI